VLYRDGDAWKPVTAGDPGGAASGPNASDLPFNPVQTTALRLQVQLQPGKSGGILEWNVRE
jgi:uncharacterized protein